MKKHLRMPKATQEISSNSAAIVAAVFADLSDAARSKHQYKIYAQNLASVPEGERNLDWVQAQLLNDGVARRHANVSSKVMNQLRLAYQLRGELAEFNRFYELYKRRISPYTLGTHGYVIALEHRDQSEVVRGAVRLISELERIGYQSFINSGTLLGAIRTGRLIPHDDDVDLAVLIEGNTFDELGKSWNKLKADLNDAGLLDQKFDRKTKLPIAKMNSTDGAVIDFFPAWITDGSVFVWPHTFGECVVDDLLPLQTIELQDQQVPAPKKPEKFLELNYGKSWRVPDPSFIFPWDAARKKFKPFLKSCRNHALESCRESNR